MNAYSLRAALAAALTLCGGLACAAPPPALDKDPVGFLRFLETSPSPPARAARREAAAGPAALARERAFARQEGIAVFPAQLNRPLPPDGQNAAPLYRKAEALRRGRVRLPIYAETLSARFAYTPAQLDRIQKIYDDNPEVFALLRQATDRPQCVFAQDWATDALNPPFQQYAGLRETARELKTEGVLEAERGRYGEAVVTVGRVYRVAGHAAGQPTLVSYLVAEAINAIATSGMQDLLTLAGPNAAVDAQVEQAVSGRSARLSLRPALRGEVAITNADFSLLRRGGPAALGSLVSGDTSAPRPAATLTPRDRRFYASLLDAAEADSIHAMRATLRRIDTSGEAAAFARAGREAQAPSDDLVQEISRRLSPLQFDILSAVPMRSAASRQVTRAAAAVLAERAKAGAYPDALPGAFADPYTGKPLGYRREGADGFVVYSGGRDGKYDGGRPRDKSLVGAVRFRYPTIPVPVPAADQQ